MKIMYLAAADSIHSFKWIKFFAEKKINTTWISLTKSEFKINKSIKIHQIADDFRIFSIFKAIFLIRKLIKKEKPDIIHVHYLGLFALITFFVSHSKIISTVWGSDINGIKNNFVKKFFVKNILNRSKLITCDAHYMASKLELYSEKDKINIINFGIDTKKFFKHKLNPLIKKKLNLQKKITVFSMRNFEEVYDIFTFILAAKIVLNEDKNIQFVLIGRGSLENDIQGKIDELGLSSYIKIINHLPNDILPEILSNFDIYVSTALSDAGISASTAEAMACELPVIVTNVADNDKWIRDGQNGFLFQAGNHNELAHIIVNLLKDHLRRFEIGKQGRKTIIQKNDYDNEMAKMMSLYERLV